MKRADIRILAFDYIDAGLMKDLEYRLGEVFPNMRVEAELGYTLPIPDGAYSPRRDQYVTTALLNALERLPDPSARVLGVANVDLYAPDLRYVFGQARILGREAIISLARLRHEFYGRPPNRMALLQRARVEAVHELGHTLGLEHCLDHHCVMYLSNGIAHTDRKSDEYCEQCWSELVDLIDKFPAKGVR